jgi:Asp-tRNA(Asn)/Glu-tRNA(Gln) amidotransferase B subunit
MPGELKLRLEELAYQSGRSLTAEIVSRLQRSLTSAQVGESDQVLADLTRQKDLAAQFERFAGVSYGAALVLARLCRDLIRELESAGVPVDMDTRSAESMARLADMDVKGVATGVLNILTDEGFMNFLRAEAAKEGNHGREHRP